MTSRTAPSGPGSEKGVPVDALSGDLSRHDLHAAMRLHLMPKPTIAMVGGPAVGAGCSLAAACDLRFASDDAVFSVNFSPNGLSGDYGGSFFWTRIGGTALARRLYLLNEKIPLPWALELGMVHAVLPPTELRAYTYEVAETLVRTPSTLLALVKDNLNAAEDEVERRRWLFAHEAENQLTSAKTSPPAGERAAAGRGAAGDLSQCDPLALACDGADADAVAVAAVWKVADAEASGPLHTATVAARAQRIPAAMTRPLCNSIRALWLRNVGERRGERKNQPRIGRRIGRQPAPAALRSATIWWCRSSICTAWAARSAGAREGARARAHGSAARPWPWPDR